VIIDESEIEHKQASEPKSGGPQTAVCSALPMPLTLRVFRKIDYMEPTPLGNRTPATRFECVESHVIDGCNVNLRGTNSPATPIAFALSFLPTPFCEEWIKQNPDSSLLESGVLIFSKLQDKQGEDEIRSRAQEALSGKLRSGFEPLNPSDLPRAGFSINSNLVETADESRNVKKAKKAS
jgi:hypothetical protein